MSDPYSEVKLHFDSIEGVTVNTGTGAQGMKVGKKMFAMFYKGELVVMLSPERVSELIDIGSAEPFDPGTGKPMKNRVLVTKANKDTWIGFCEESRRYMESLAN